jgi:hypothetical protein
LYKWTSKSEFLGRCIEITIDILNGQLFRVKLEGSWARNYDFAIDLDDDGRRKFKLMKRRELHA